MTTVYIITIVAFALFLLSRHIYFVRAYYSDKTLFKLRALKHDAIMHLSENLEPSKKPGEIRYLIAQVDLSVNKFDQVVKKEFGTVSGMKRLIDSIFVSSDRARSIKTEGNEVLESFKIQFSRALLSAFDAVPFGWVRLLGVLLRIVFSLFIKLGVIRLKRSLATLSALERTYEEDKISSRIHLNQC